MADPTKTSENGSGDWSLDNEPGEVSRRNFMKMGIGLLSGLMVVAYGGLGLKYMWPPSQSSIKPEKVGKSSDFKTYDPKSKDPKAKPQRVTTNNQGSVGGAWIVRFKDQGLVAYDMHCTHLQCPYQWAGTMFACPCHGSQFNVHGQVIHPPAPRPLRHRQVYEKNGDVYVGGITS